MDIVALLAEHYGESPGFTNIRLSGQDPNGGRALADLGPVRAIIETDVIGGRNAGAFRGWFKVDRRDYRRIKADVPAGYARYTLTIGLTPDDEQVWWIALYDEDALRDAPWESMDGDRWYRLPPDEANLALIGKIVDLSQLPMFEVAAVDPTLRMGMPWAKQQLRVPPEEVLAKIKTQVITDLRAWDHNHPDHEVGESNKQVTIIGAMITGNDRIEYEEAREVAVRAAFTPGFTVKDKR